MNYARLHATHVRAERSGVRNPQSVQRFSPPPFHPAAPLARPLLQRCACGVTCESCRKKEADGAIARATEVADGPGGRQLDDGARQEMEPRFGHSFGDVRVFEDAEAARAVNARAY